MEQFHYNLQRSKHSDLDPEILKTIFIRAMRDDCFDMMNLLGKGDTSQESFDEIKKVYLRCWRGSSRGRIMVWDGSIRIHKFANGAVTKAKIGNLFENIKIGLLSTLSAQIMTTQVKKAQE